MRRRGKIALWPGLACVGLASAGLLGGCASVTPAGLIAASRLDPLNTSPGAIAVAVGTPETVRLADGDAVFRIALSVDDPAPTTLVEATAPLLMAPTGAQRPPLAAPGEVVYVARLSPEDAARVAAAQAEIRSLRESGVRGRGSISIAVVGGCVVGPPVDALPVSTWLRTDPDAAFAPLTRRRDAMAALDPAQVAALRARLVPCDGAAAGPG